MGISIHAPRTGSDRVARNDFDAGNISIHAPRTGSDGGVFDLLIAHAVFQSTLPARGATNSRLFGQFSDAISIHAPRTGSDRSRAGHSPRRRDFNPRSPHGERRSADWRGRVPPEHFNPRSPHGERRRIATSFCATADNFNPRSPHGERREAVQLCRDENISIHAPRTGSDSPFG